jgi:hypothetical protein
MLASVILRLRTILISRPYELDSFLRMIKEVKLGDIEWKDSKHHVDKLILEFYVGTSEIINIHDVK